MKVLVQYYIPIRGGSDDFEVLIFYNGQEYLVECTKFL